MAERYGANPYVGAWQTDNEYSCHDTTHSYSDSARTAFKSWLRVQYAGSGNDGDINALNEAWGNVFWSMEYENFDQIDLPNLTVTQPNHLTFWIFDGLALIKLFLSIGFRQILLSHILMRP